MSKRSRPWTPAWLDMVFHVGHNFRTAFQNEFRISSCHKSLWSSYLLTPFPNLSFCNAINSGGRLGGHLSFSQTQEDKYKRASGWCSNTYLLSVCHIIFIPIVSFCTVFFFKFSKFPFHKNLLLRNIFYSEKIRFSRYFSNFCLRNIESV